MEKKKTSVLICDDAAFLRKIMRDTLEKNDFEVVGEAADSQQALEQFHRLEPDVVLLDLLMGDTDSLETLRQILQERPRFPVVPICDRGAPNLLAEALKLGAPGGIFKPFPPEKLLDQIHQVLNTR